MGFLVCIFICFAYTLYCISIVLLDNYSLRSCSLRSRYLYIYYILLILFFFLKDLSLYTLFLGQSRQIFSKKIVTSLLIKHLAFKIFVAKISVFDAREHKMVKFEARTEDDLWRICDILRQMAYKFVPVGRAVLVEDMKEDERLSILYLVRCKCVQPTEFDLGLL